MIHSGYVLAGGRSSRMGRNKALLPFDAATLAERICRAVTAAAGSATLIGPAQPALRHIPSLPDLYPGEGPLGGILTARVHTRAEWNLIVACDLPRLDGPFLSRLLSLAAASQAEVLLPCDPEGRPQPLCAAYRRGARSALEAAFHSGIRAVHTALTRVAVERVTIAEAGYFQNLNTPQDWAAYDAK